MKLLNLLNGFSVKEVAFPIPPKFFMITKNKFWKDIEADDKALKKVEKMIEKKDKKAFGKFAERQRKEPYFWRKEKNNKDNWL